MTKKLILLLMLCTCATAPSKGFSFEGPHCNPKEPLLRQNDEKERLKYINLSFPIKLGKNLVLNPLVQVSGTLLTLSPQKTPSEKDSSLLCGGGVTLTLAF